MTEKETIVITGGLGFIGRAVAEKLAGKYDIIVLDNEPQPEKPLGANIEYHHFDITSDESLREIVDKLRGESIASVVHLAAYYDFSGKESDLYQKVTIDGTRRLLEKVKVLNPGQFLFAGTLLVHVPGGKDKKIDEDWPIDPQWPYPESKTETEEVIRMDHGNVPYVILRAAGVYNNECHSIPLAHQIQRIYENRLTSHFYPADTSCGQPFVHLDDLVDAVTLCVQRRNELDEETIYLIGEPETYSYGQLQKALGKLIHDEDDWKTHEIPKILARTGIWVEGKIPGLENPFIQPWMVDAADDHYELDISRAEQQLGWHPRHRLITVLPKMIEALKRDPEVWYKQHKLGEPKAAEHRSHP